MAELHAIAEPRPALLARPALGAFLQMGFWILHAGYVLLNTGLLVVAVTLRLLALLPSALGYRLLEGRTELHARDPRAPRHAAPQGVT